MASSRPGADQKRPPDADAAHRRRAALPTVDAAATLWERFHSYRSASIAWKRRYSLATRLAWKRFYSLAALLAWKRLYSFF